MALADLELHRIRYIAAIRQDHDVPGLEHYRAVGAAFVRERVDVPAAPMVEVRALVGVSPLRHHRVFAALVGQVGSGPAGDPYGFGTRSPSFISQRRPLTMVTAPSARVEKRIAAALWRCGTARSPGSSTVKAAIRFCVVTVSPPNAGLARISARRSTSSIATSFAARTVKGSISRQRQCIGASLAQGETGVMRLYRSQSGWRFDRSSAWIREASTLVNRSRARTESGDVQQTADDREVLQEVVHLVVELSRIGDFPETVRRECRHDHEQHEQPCRPASAPADDEQDRAADLDDDRDHRHYFRGRKAELGEVGGGAGESHHLADARDEEYQADENAPHQGNDRVVGRCCADVGHSGSLLVPAIMPASL